MRSRSEHSVQRGATGLSAEDRMITCPARPRMAMRDRIRASVESHVMFAFLRTTTGAGTHATSHR